MKNFENEKQKTNEREMPDLTSGKENMTKRKKKKKIKIENEDEKKLKCRLKRRYTHTHACLCNTQWRGAIIPKHMNKTDRGRSTFPLAIRWFFHKKLMVGLIRRKKALSTSTPCDV